MVGLSSLSPVFVGEHHIRRHRFPPFLPPGTASSFFLFFFFFLLVYGSGGEGFRSALPPSGVVIIFSLGGRDGCVASFLFSGGVGGRWATFLLFLLPLYGPFDSVGTPSSPFLSNSVPKEFWILSPLSLKSLLSSVDRLAVFLSPLFFFSLFGQCDVGQFFTGIKIKEN